MTTPEDRGWGFPGAPDSIQERAYRKLLTTVEVGGVKLVVRREVAPIFHGFFTELGILGYHLDVNADDWGFANRDIRGRPGVKSNHAWGLAVDANAIDNPMAAAHRHHAGDRGHDAAGVHTDMPPGTAALAERWGLRWGANYSGTRKDAMHFEFLGSPRDVARYPLGNLAAPKPHSPSHNPKVLMARIPDAAGFCFLPNRDLVIADKSGGLYYFDADGQVDDKEWADAYNVHPEWWGGANPQSNRTCIGVEADGPDHVVEVFDDGATYRVAT